MRDTGKITILVLFWAAMATAFAYAAPATQTENAPSTPQVEASMAKVPKAVFPEAKYTFDAVYEGVDIKHDFVVENHGDAPLVISRIRPD